MSRSFGPTKIDSARLLLALALFAGGCAAPEPTAERQAQTAVAADDAVSEGPAAEGQLVDPGLPPLRAPSNRVGAVQASVDFLENFLAETRARAARGEATPTDVALVEARLAAAEARLAAATGGLDLAREAYRGGVGHAP